MKAVNDFKNWGEANRHFHIIYNSFSPDSESQKQVICEFYRLSRECINNEQKARLLRGFDSFINGIK